MFVGVTPTILRPLLAAVPQAPWAGTADAGSGMTFTNGNRTAIGSNLAPSARGLVSKSSGKWYFEMVATALQTNVPTAGFATSFFILGDSVGNNAESVGYSRGGAITTAGSSLGSADPWGASGAVLGFALDLTVRSARLYLNGTLKFTINTAGALPGGPLFPAVTLGSGDQMTLPQFVQFLPADYSVWA